METQEILQFIRKELGIAYQEKGRNIFFSCPFHTDKTPSLSFSKENKFFKCFSCGFKAKNIFIFWARVKKISLNKTLEKFAELGYTNYLNPVPEEEREPVGEKILKLASEIYQHNLLTAEGNKQLDYLCKKRQLNSAVIEQFELGTTIANNQLSKLFFENKLFSISELADSNLFQIKDKSDSNDFFWRKQIIFPLKNETGKLVSFASRNLDTEREGKYFFLPSSRIVQKSLLIYNYDKVRELNEKFCYLVEGFFDVINLTKMGFHSSLSTLGTAVSNEQMKLLKKLEKEIIIFFDGDQAGTEATIKIAVLLMLNDIDCGVIEQQSVMDPDELCLQGSEEINKVIRKKRSPIAFIIEYYFKKMQIEESPQKIRSFILKIADLFAQLRRNIQLFVIKKISVITGMTVNETRELYFSDSKHFIYEDDQLNLLERSIIYYSYKERSFWAEVNNKNSNFSIEKNQSLWKIIDNFYIENPTAENFSEFEKREEFSELPFFNESHEEKLRILQLFTQRETK